MKDRVILVTGAARGLGLEISRLLAEQGARVVGADVRSELLESQLQEWPQEIRERVSTIDLDVADEAAVTGAIRELVEQRGQIDALINNAGIRIVDPIWAFATPDWDRVHAVNLKAQFILTREVLNQSMLRRDQGILIFISSLAGLRGVPGGAAYSSSKWGIRGLAASIAQDLKATNIRVSCFLPGMLLTPMARESEVWDRGLEWLDPKAVARAVVFCLQQDPDTVLPEIIIHNRAQI